MDFNIYDVHTVVEEKLSLLNEKKICWNWSYLPKWTLKPEMCWNRLGFTKNHYFLERDEIASREYCCKFKAKETNNAVRKIHFGKKIILETLHLHWKVFSDESIEGNKVLLIEIYIILLIIRIFRLHPVQYVIKLSTGKQFSYNEEETAAIKEHFVDISK